MRKTFAVLILILSVVAVQANIQPGDIVGKWKYVVDTGSEQYTGFFSFELENDKLIGNIHADTGTVIPFTKIEIGEDNELLLECLIDYETIKIEVKVDGKRFSGIGSSYSGEAPIRGEKLND